MAPGRLVPDGPRPLLVASGAAFMAVVIGQAANAFACRSSTRWPGALGWTTNRLLIPAASVELVFVAVVLFVVPIANQLGQANPPLAGWLVALATAPLMLGVDAWYKVVHQRRRGSWTGAR